MLSDGPVWFAHELRYNMQIANRAKEFCDITKFPINVYLLQVCLCASFRIRHVLRTRALQDLYVVLRHSLFFDERPSQFVLRKAQFIARCVVLFFADQFYADDDVRILFAARQRIADTPPRFFTAC